MGSVSLKEERRPRQAGPRNKGSFESLGLGKREMQGGPLANREKKNPAPKAGYWTGGDCASKRFPSVQVPGGPEMKGGHLSKGNDLVRSTNLFRRGKVFNSGRSHRGLSKSSILAGGRGSRSLETGRGGSLFGRRVGVERSNKSRAPGSLIRKGGEKREALICKKSRKRMNFMKGKVLYPPAREGQTC